MKRGALATEPAQAEIRFGPRAAGGGFASSDTELLGCMETWRSEQVACTFCRGTGKDPFGIMSSLSTCCVCGGPGSVIAPAPHMRCAHCDSTGAIKTFTCTVCGGKGVVPAPDGPWTGCPECGGSGDDASTSAMACLRCRGRGWLPAAAGTGKGRTEGMSEA